MSEDDRQAAYERVRAVKNAYEDELMARANVVGVGIGLRQKHGVPSNETALVVMVTRKVPRSQLKPEDVIPAELEGIPVDVQEVGEIRAQ